MSKNADDWGIVLRDADTYEIRLVLGPKSQSIQYYDAQQRESVDLYMREGGYTSFWLTLQPGFERYYTPLEATLNIQHPGFRPRDILEIISRGGFPYDSTNESYFARWSGRILAGSNEYNPLDGTFRVEAEGVFRELDQSTEINTSYGAGQDVGFIAARIFQDCAIASRSPLSDTTSIDPGIGVATTGDVAAGYAHLWRPGDSQTPLAALAALAEAAGTPVAVGATAGYVTYFRVKGNTVATFNEGDPGVQVDWLEPQGQETVTDVRWIIATGNYPVDPFDDTRSVGLETPDIVSYLSRSGITGFGARRVSLNPENPQGAFLAVDPLDEVWLPFMNGTIGAVDTDGNVVSAITKDGVQGDGEYDESNPFTVDPLPYALSAGDAISFTGVGHFFLREDAAAGATELTGVKYQSSIADGESGYPLGFAYDGDERSYVVGDGSGSFGWIADGTSPPAGLVRLMTPWVFQRDAGTENPDRTRLYVRGQLRDGGVQQSRAVLTLKGSVPLANPYRGTPGLTSGDLNFQENLIIGDRAAYQGDIEPYADLLFFWDLFSGSTEADAEIGVRDMRIWHLHEAALDGAAETEYRLPELGSVQVTTHNTDPELPTHLTVDLLNKAVDSSTFEQIPVSQIRIEVSPEEGVRTTYRTGVRFAPGVERTSALIKARDRQAALSGARARLGER